MPFCPHCGTEVAVAGESCASCYSKEEIRKSETKIQSGFSNTIKHGKSGATGTARLGLKRTKTLESPETTLQHSENDGWEGKLVLAVVLNVLWAGVGNMVVKAPKGGMIAGINIIAYVLAIATGGILVVVPLALFIWSTVIAYRYLRYSADSP